MKKISDLLNAPQTAASFTPATFDDIKRIADEMREMSNNFMAQLRTPERRYSANNLAFAPKEEKREPTGFPLSEKNLQTLRAMKARMVKNKGRGVTQFIGINQISSQVIFTARQDYGELDAWRARTAADLRKCSYDEMVTAIALKTGYGQKRVRRLLRRAARKNSELDLALVGVNVTFNALMKQAQTQIIMTNTEFMNGAMFRPLVNYEPIVMTDEAIEKMRQELREMEWQMRLGFPVLR